MELIYSAGNKVHRVRFALIVVAATLILFGIIVGPCSIPFSAALLAAMIVFLHCFTAKIYLDTERDALIIETLTLTGVSVHLVRPMAITRSSFNDEFFRNRATANTFWFSVYIKDRLLPFIIDTQGEFYDWETALRVFSI